MASRGRKKNKGFSLTPPKRAIEPNPLASQIEITQRSIRGFRGPIPPPEILAGYDQVEKGLGNQIVRMAVEQSSHRQHMEKTLLHAQIADAKSNRTERRIGQFLAFGIAVIIISVGGYAMTHEAQWPGALLGSAGVTGLVMAFLNQRQGRKSADKPEGGEDGQ